MEVGSWDYVAVFAVTAALTLILTPQALRIAVRRGIFDRPSGVKTQQSPVPYLGGLAILLSFALVVLAASLVRPPASGPTEIAVILGLATLLAVMGLVDDLRGLSPRLRFAVEAAVGVCVWATPAGADLVPHDGVNAVITVLWIVLVTNAFNLLDNMDGLSAGVAAISSLFLCLLAASNGQFLVATLSIALAGCAVGFLRSNFHPARIYMGDAGALFIGFLLSVLALKLAFPEAPGAVGLGVPVLLLGVPLFDTSLVVVNRLLHRRNPFLGGRDHTSHRLVFIGVPVPASVALIYVCGASLGCLAIVLAQLDRGTAYVLLAWLVVLGALLGVLLSQVPVYETSRRRHLMLQEVASHEPPPAPADAQGGEARSA